MGDLDSLLERKTRRVRELEAEAKRLRKEVVRPGYEALSMLVGALAYDGDVGVEAIEQANEACEILRAALRGTEAG